MTQFKHTIQQVDLPQIIESKFAALFVGCIVLTQDNKILLQQRGIHFKTFPGFISEFGGRIEHNEHPTHALIRELREELGAQVQEADIINLGAITEKATNFSELIYAYFWHDKLGTISGCYEGEAKYFETAKAVLDHHKVMDSVRWLLKECQNRQLLK